MRTFNWLLRGLLFIVLFAFALNNQHTVELHWFLGYQWQAPMVFVVLAAFAMGCVFGVLAMLPSWWRHRRDARQREQLVPSPIAHSASVVPGGDRSATHASPVTMPAELPYPPDMPAPRKPTK